MAILAEVDALFVNDGLNYIQEVPRATVTATPAPEVEVEKAPGGIKSKRKRTAEDAEAYTEYLKTLTKAEDYVLEGLKRKAPVRKQSVRLVPDAREELPATLKKEVIQHYVAEDPIEVAKKQRREMIERQNKEIINLFVNNKWL